MITWRLRIQIAPLAHPLADALGAVVMRHFRQALSRGQGPHRQLLAGDGGRPRCRSGDPRPHQRGLPGPDHGILGEEHGHERPDARFTWVIDPIDGTKAFITGMPTWGTLIALQDRGKGIIGMLGPALPA